MIFNLTICSFIQKVWNKCPASCKKLTKPYGLKVRTPNVRGVGSTQTPADNGGGESKNWQNLADVLYGWPLANLSWTSFFTKYSREKEAIWLQHLLVLDFIAKNCPNFKYQVFIVACRHLDTFVYSWTWVCFRTKYNFRYFICGHVSMQIVNCKYLKLGE